MENSQGIEVALPNLKGMHLLLRWSTYEERGHVITATSVDQALVLFAVVLKEHGSVEVGPCWDAELVAPSEELELAYVEEKRKEAIVYAWCDLQRKLEEMIECGVPLPPQFSRCPGYEPTEERKREEIDEWDRKRHEGCKHCGEHIPQIDGVDPGKLPLGMGSGVISNLSPLQIYEKLSPILERIEKEEDERIERERKVRCPKRVEKKTRWPSTARKALPDEELWIINERFGHHSDGVVVDKIERPFSENLRLGWFRPITFFVTLPDQSRAEELLRRARELVEQEKRHEQERKKLGDKLRLEREREYEHERKKLSQRISEEIGKVEP